MSIFLPDFIWLASGSIENFKFELFEPLKKEILLRLLIKANITTG